LLSLTLRDAQHLSWKTFKKFEMIDEKRSAGLGSAVDLVKKASEIAVKIDELEKSGAGGKKEEIGKLLSELLFIMFVVAERQGLSLEDSFLQSVDELILGFVS
jgi:hypothetical protein